ncbi:hypothetical protein NPIL_92641 [Nephila pilipes]|uniref:Uncharacterized protein n=1 Tax=Nephila pilipes TaxID=299642 RepID=A0A8X6P866_NEPPI|nr:hypothetical protein NPIL_92641 [Nephila pilipes]
MWLMVLSLYRLKSYRKPGLSFPTDSKQSFKKFKSLFHSLFREAITSMKRFRIMAATSALVPFRDGILRINRPEAFYFSYCAIVMAICRTRQGRSSGFTAIAHPPSQATGV